MAGRQAGKLDTTADGLTTLNRLTPRHAEDAHLGTSTTVGAQQNIRACLERIPARDHGLGNDRAVVRRPAPLFVKARDRPGDD